MTIKITALDDGPEGEGWNGWVYIGGRDGNEINSCFAKYKKWERLVCLAERLGYNNYRIVVREDDDPTVQDALQLSQSY